MPPAIAFAFNVVAEPEHTGLTDAVAAVDTVTTAVSEEVLDITPIVVT